MTLGGGSVYTNQTESDITTEPPGIFNVLMIFHLFDADLMNEIKTVCLTYFLSLTHLLLLNKSNECNFKFMIYFSHLGFEYMAAYFL